MSAVQAEIVDNAFWQSSTHNWTNGSLKIVNGVQEGTTDTAD